MCVWNIFLMRNLFLNHCKLILPIYLIYLINLSSYSSDIEISSYEKIEEEQQREHTDCSFASEISIDLLIDTILEISTRLELGNSEQIKDTFYYWLLAAGPRSDKKFETH